MKKSLKSLTLIALTIAAIMTLGFGAVQAQAASKTIKDIKGIKWDLVPDKTITYETVYAAVGAKKKIVKMTNFTKGNAEKAGYKEVKFELTFSYKWKPSKNQVHKICKSKDGLKDRIGGRQYYAIVDYNTGKNLEVKNPYNVTVSAAQFKEEKTKFVKDKDGCKVPLKTVSRIITITYPEDYDGLCIGVGGIKTTYGKKTELKFWEGKKTLFDATALYSTKYKKMAHFMKVD